MAKSPTPEPVEGDPVTDLPDQKTPKPALEPVPLPDAGEEWKPVPHSASQAESDTHSQTDVLETIINDVLAFLHWCFPTHNRDATDDIPKIPDQKPPPSDVTV